MAYYSAFFDASANEAMVTVAGIVAPIRSLMRFQREWQAVLDEQQIRVFHMTDFASSKREFLSWLGQRDRRVKFISELTEVIRATVSRAVAVSVDLFAWKQVDEIYKFKENYGSPYALAGVGAVGEVERWAKRKNFADPIEYIFEAGDRGRGHLIGQLTKQDIEPLFKAKDKAVPCQAADLIAWKHRTAASKASLLSVEDEAAWKDIQKSLKTIHVIESRAGVYNMTAFNKMCSELNIPKRKP